MAMWISVDPTLTEDGYIRSLYPRLKEEARPYPEAPQIVNQDTGAQIVDSFYETTSEFAVSLGYGGMFQSSVDGFYRSFIMETSVSVPKMRPVAEPGLVRGTRWGFSVRVAMRIRTLQAKMQLDLSMVAAAVEVGAAEIAYSITALGIDRKTCGVALAGIPLFGKLDYNTYSKMRDGIGTLREAMGQRLINSPLLPISVFLARNPYQLDIFGEARSVRWAIVKIANQIEFPVAITQAPDWVDRKIAQDVYAQLTKNRPITREVADLASKWWTVR